jgi:hypothetical protein
VEPNEDEDEGGETEGTQDDHPSEEPLARRRRRRWPWAILAVLAVAGSLGLLLLISLTGIRTDLLRARESMRQGADLLLDGEAEAAVASFEEGRRSFESAEHVSNGIVLRVVGWIPMAGRTPDAVRAIAASGVSTADAALVIAEAVTEIPGGAAGLAPSNGAIPLDPLPGLAEAAREAETLMDDAVAEIRAAPSSLLVGPVAPARRTAEEELTDLRDAVHSAAVVLDGLPAFLGADGPRSYFFGAQNPAELRGTGGVIGAYSILTVDDGRFDFGTFRPIQSLGVLPLDAVDPPNADFETNYQSFRGGRRYWTAINVMPDFPTVAEVILRSYEATTGDRLDGVLLADPFALETILRSTGPVEVPRYGIDVDAGSVVSFVANEAYSVFPDPTSRKRILGDVAEAAFTRFLAKPTAELRDLRLLLRAARDRHLQVYSADPAMQGGLGATSSGGALAPSGAGDLVSVVVTSSSGSKVDYYQEREVVQTVSLNEGGSANVDLGLRLQNDAPTSGQPRYVIGPYQPSEADGRVGALIESLEAGDSVALVNVYCGTDCVPGAVRMNGGDVEATTRSDLGVRYVQQYFAIPSGEEALLEVAWHAPRGWEGNSSGGIYRMTFANQITIRPATVRLVIEPPDGMRVRTASAPLRIVGGTAVYEGVPGSRLELEVEFAPSVPTRLWRNITRFLTSPVF